ncbi:MAG TPA: DNA-directed RNA polymerase subunit alpha C-terminal domain-containing protein [Anaerolineaceae bacterium]
MQARQSFVDQQKARESERTSPEKSVADLGLSSRASDALVKGGVTTVGQVLEKLGQGEAAMLAIDGFGRKSLIDLKKRLRQLGYDLPEAANEISV